MGLWETHSSLTPGQSMSPELSINSERLNAFCRRWKIAELALFGSVLTNDFTPESDVDLLVTFAAGADWGLLDLVRMQQQLAEMLGRDVDLVTRRGIERSSNWIRREHILSSAEPIYASR